MAQIELNGITGCISKAMSSRYARASGGLREGCVRAAKVRNVPGAADAPSNACLAEDTSTKCTRCKAGALQSKSRRLRQLVVTEALSASKLLSLKTSTH